MPTLHDTTDGIKKIAKWTGIGLGCILVIFLIIQGSAFFIKTFFPKPATPPQQAFGKLPKIIFPTSITNLPKSYRLDTVSGNLGQFSDRTNVYKVLSDVPTLLDLQKTRAALSKTPFTSNETYITDTEYSWVDSDRVDKKITTNIVSNDFTITSSFQTYPEIIATSSIDPASGVEQATDFLKKLSLYPLDLTPEKTTTQLLAIQGTSIFAASSLSTAQLVRVDFFQSDINKLPIMYPHPPKSLLYLLIGGFRTDEILEGTFYHQTISSESSTYPIISVQDAYDILKKGDAYFASYYGSSTIISIKNVYLGYFLGESKQDFIMPIYVFEGRDGFFAYVSAVQNTSLR